MKNFKSLLFALPVALAVSCGGGSKQTAIPTGEPYTVSFDIETIDPDAPFPALSEMVDSIEYVKLELVPDMPIGIIMTRPIITDEHIFISDIVDQGVLQYTRQGRFVRRIGAVGRGPGEYSWASSMLLDRGRNIFYIFQGFDDKLLGYDLSTGRFIGETSIIKADGSEWSMFDNRTNVIHQLSDSVALLTYVSSLRAFRESAGLEMEDYLFSLIDINSARITYNHKSGIQSGEGLALNLWRDPEGRINVFDIGVDKAFVINDDLSTRDRLFFDMGPNKYEFVSMDQRSSTSSHTLTVIPPTKGIHIQGIMESDRYFVFTMHSANLFENKNRMMSFDKTTGERSLGPLLADSSIQGLANDIDGGFSGFAEYDGNLSWASYDAYKMIENLTPEHFARVRGSVKDPAKLDALQAFVATLKEEDNPVIAIAHLKQ